MKKFFLIVVVLTIFVMGASSAKAEGWVDSGFDWGSESFSEWGTDYSDCSYFGDHCDYGLGSDLNYSDWYEE